MLRALACAILFLTRIPLPRFTLDASDFARSSGFFAWVGALLAALLWIASALLTPALGARLSALLLIVLWVAITGGLHLDGLADTVDGVSGGRSERARTLEIMRDSRIGSHGAVALVL
jgi:adenosylcobinamide-GDP ribazoletransferase